MQTQKGHSILAALLLIIFSIGTVYDACAEKGPQLESTSPSPSPLSSDPVTPPSSSDSDPDDCHCLCHFSFQPENEFGFEGATHYQPLALPITESIKEPLPTGVFRPPIPFLSI